VNRCDRCKRERGYNEAYYRGLHEGYARVCYDCHAELLEEMKDAQKEEAQASETEA
jgi:hypothetical protein